MTRARYVQPVSRGDAVVVGPRPFDAMMMSNISQSPSASPSPHLAVTTEMDKAYTSLLEGISEKEPLRNFRASLSRSEKT